MLRCARNFLSGPALLFAVAGAVSSVGCTHNYYYGPPQACVPATPGSTGTVQYGAVCDVPTQVVGGSTVVAGVPVPQSSAVLSGPRPPRVVLSEPDKGPRLSWRRADPEGGLATTRVEGATTDSTLTR
jgi:hypothetical protein